MLWSAGGEVGAGVIGGYDTTRPSAPTVYGRAVPYIRSLVEDAFDLDRLLFARLAVMADDVLVPHRDYVELAGRPGRERATYRLHVPLATHDDCLFVEGDVVFRMRRGEIWVLEVDRLHSAGVLSERERVHLILDFAGGGTLEELLRFEVTTEPGIPQSHRVERPVLGDDEHKALLGLAPLIDLDNLYQMLAILTKKTYRRGCSENYAWETLAEIAARSGEEAVQAKVRELHDYCVLARER
jgi:hypothetical protein